MCFVSVKQNLLLSLPLCHCSHLTDTTIIITITACPQLFTILLTTAVLLEFHTQLVTRLLEFVSVFPYVYLMLMLLVASCNKVVEFVCVGVFV